MMNKIIFFICFSLSYLSCQGQKGFYVDKDYRIKKYQKEIVIFLLDKNEIEYKDKAIKVSDYSGEIEIVKCLEIFKNQFNKESILLIRFNSLASHSTRYWGVLENNKKHFFYYDEQSISKIEEYLKDYDDVTKKQILLYVQRYLKWYYKI